MRANYFTSFETGKKAPHAKHEEVKEEHKKQTKKILVRRQGGRPCATTFIPRWATFSATKHEIPLQLPVSVVSSSFLAATEPSHIFEWCRPLKSYDCWDGQHGGDWAPVGAIMNKINDIEKKRKIMRPATDEDSMGPLRWAHRCGRCGVTKLREDIS